MMALSSKGEALLKSFEALRLTAYQDQKGVWTIGWGHTAPDVVEGLTCDLPIAEHWFLMDTQAACNAVTAHTDVPITQNQFDAMVSLTFNIGIHAFSTSTLLAKFNAKQVQAAADQFCRWDHISGVYNAGLAKRRAEERALFLA